MALAACNAPEPAPQKQRVTPALWKVADADTTLYLFGSVHQLPEGYDWDEGKLPAAIDASSMLVLEISPDEAGRASAALNAMARDTPGPPLAERLPANLRPELTLLIQRGGRHRAELDALESWAAALMLSQMIAADHDLSAARGVEAVLATRFQADGKPVRGLERAGAQLAIFDRLPEQAQRALLAQVIKDAPDSRDRLDAMIDAWAKGRVDALAAIVAEESTAIAELRKPLLIDRNAAWTTWAAQRMKEPGTIFIAVGAGHLVGPDSVLAMLAAKGYPATRVQ